MATKTPANRRTTRSKAPKGTVDPWRPSKLTPEVSEVIVAAVRNHNHLETAAGLAGLSVSTVRLWAREGARITQRCQKYPEDIASLSDLDRQMVDFSAALIRANAEAERDSVDTIGRAGNLHSIETKRVRKHVGVTKDGEVIYAEEVTVTEKPPDWRAEAFRLERRFPTRWGQTVRNEITGPDGGPVTVDLLMAKFTEAKAMELEPGEVIDTTAE